MGGGGRRGSALHGLVAWSRVWCAVCLVGLAVGAWLRLATHDRRASALVGASAGGLLVAGSVLVASWWARRRLT